MFETLAYEVRDGVALIKLNREQRHNAVNSAMSRELPEAWRRFDEDSSARVAIVTGAGTQAFCSGADLVDLPDSGTLDAIRWTSLQNEVWKPVICAVNGMAAGGGLHFVADSDIVIAAASASFFDTHVKVGLCAGLEPVGLCRRMPMQAVLRIALTGGERMSAAQALQLGLVGEVVSAEELLPRAYQLADMIKVHSPSALARTKQAIWQSADLGLHEGLRNAWRLVAEQVRHPDFEEGARAFAERRAPRWS